MTTALDLQKPPVSDLRGQGAQMILALKMTLLCLSLVWVNTDGVWIGNRI
jgi:hypothetical protein